MSSHPHISAHSREIPLSSVTLSAAAESGAVARDLGFIPARQTTAPVRREISPASVLYIWPAPARRRAP